MRECECRSVPTPGEEEVFNFYAIVIFLPIMSTIGLSTNLCSIYIYSRPSKHPTNRYLSALSISDFGICLTGLLVICADSLRSYNYMVDQIWVFLLPKLIPFGMFFQMLSVYITVIAALDCFIGVSRYCVSIKMWYCTVRNATKLIWVTVAITAAYNLIVFGELETVHCFQPELNITLYELCPTEMRLNEDYISIYRGYMYAAVMAFIPFALLVLFTIGILVALNGKQYMPQPLADRSVHINSTGTAEESNSPTTLVLVVALFLLCNSVSLLVNIFDMISGLISESLSMIMIDVGNLLVVFNATANFFIYVSFSEVYRIALKRILQRGSKRKRPQTLI